MTGGFQLRLREIVRRAGGQQSLADRSGVAKRTIAKYVSGESEPSLGRLIALAEAADVSVEWLATGGTAVPVMDAEGSYGTAPGGGGVVPANDARAGDDRFQRVAQELESAIEEVGYRPPAMTREGLKAVMYAYGLPRAGAVVLLQFLAAADQQRQE